MKPTAVDPSTTSRAEAFELWMRAPNPMVTFFKTLDVTPLVRLSRSRSMKFNMLLCWCIGMAASSIVRNKLGEVNSCDVPFCDDLAQFERDYLRLTRKAAETCLNHDLSNHMVIGTSAIADTELDGAVGMNSGIFNNPFIIWGRYRKGIFKTTLPISFQFHHTQMDGAHAGKFLGLLQENIRTIKRSIF